MKKISVIVSFFIFIWAFNLSAQWRNAWIEVDLSAYTAAQITTFFSITENSAAYDSLSRPKKLILHCYWQARPDRLYRSKLNAKKWLVYIHFPLALADEIGSLPAIITDNVRFVGRNLRSLSTALHEEYFTGSGNGRVILNSTEAGYDSEKNYPYFNVFSGIEP